MELLNFQENQAISYQQRYYTKYAFRRKLFSLVHAKNRQFGSVWSMSVLCMNQIEEHATKRVFSVITLLIADYLISCRFNSFLSSYRFILYHCCSFTGVDSVSYKIQVSCASMVHLDDLLTRHNNAKDGSRNFCDMILCTRTKLD